jgi:hypothetical protein
VDVATRAIKTQQKSKEKYQSIQKFFSCGAQLCGIIAPFNDCSFHCYCRDKKGGYYELDCVWFHAENKSLAVGNFSM